MGPPPGHEELDDDDIPPDAILARRVYWRWVEWPDPEERLTSEAFSDSPDGTGTSVDIVEGARLPEDSLVGHPGHGLVTLTAADVRELGLGVIRVPQAGNVDHCQLQGRKKKTRKRDLNRAAQ